MSTKIFQAYRIPKDRIENISQMVYVLRQRAKIKVAKNYGLLKIIHMFAIDWYEKNPDRITEKELDDLTKGKGHIAFHIEEFLWASDKEKDDRGGITIWTNLECAFFEDSDYWYMKMFHYHNWHLELIESLVTRYDFIEDYSYQNSTDPPIDDHEAYRKRGKKWDELLRGKNNWRGGLMATILGPVDMRDLLSRNYFQGKEDVYDHLAYNFKLEKSKKILRNSKLMEKTCSKFLRGLLSLQISLARLELCTQVQKLEEARESNSIF